jgi:hypothetical protein
VTTLVESLRTEIEWTGRDAEYERDYERRAGHGRVSPCRYGHYDLVMGDVPLIDDSL